MRFWFVAAVVALLFIPLKTQAHRGNSQPYFKVDGIYGGLYPGSGITGTGLVMPDDIAPKNYVVNDSIQFDVLRDQLPYTSEINQKLSFAWDFGDGSKATGTSNKHTYTKQGSYFIVITGSYDTYDAVPIEAMLIHILPSSDYKLPTAVMKVNKDIVDPTSAVPFNQPFSRPMVFDGRNSKEGSAKIVTYRWNFEDKKTKDGSLVTYRYDDGSYDALAILRVKDSNGFISDVFAPIGNADKLAPGTQPHAKPITWPLIGLLGLVGAGFIFAIYKSFTSK